MSVASLRTHARTATAALAVAVVIPIGAVAASATPAAATASTTSVSTTVASTSAAAAAPTALTPAQKKAAKKKARKLAKKKAAQRKKAREIKRGKKVIKIAKRFRGTPYRWGASGPGAFDCSGFTSYVARKAAGVSLPHFTVAQRRHGKVDRVKPKNRQKGDLVFFHRRGTIPHVALYAGKGKMWDAPRTGYRVNKRPLHSGKKSYGRFV
jgi:cell wall-associated NlpC family hydrolase